MAVTVLSAGPAGCSGEQVGCPTIVKGHITVQVRGAGACDEVKVRFQSGVTILTEAQTVESPTDGSCGTTFLPPDSPRSDVLTLVVLDQVGHELAEEKVRRDYDQACGQYESLTVELAVP